MHIAIGHVHRHQDMHITIGHVHRHQDMHIAIGHTQRHQDDIKTWSQLRVDKQSRKMCAQYEKKRSSPRWLHFDLSASSCVLFLQTESPSRKETRQNGGSRNSVVVSGFISIPGFSSTMLAHSPQVPLSTRTPKYKRQYFMYTPILDVGALLFSKQNLAGLLQRKNDKKRKKINKRTGTCKGHARLLLIYHFYYVFCRVHDVLPCTVLCCCCCFLHCISLSLYGENTVFQSLAKKNIPLILLARPNTPAAILSSIISAYVNE